MVAITSFISKAVAFASLLLLTVSTTAVPTENISENISVYPMPIDTSADLAVALEQRGVRVNANITIFEEEGCRGRSMWSIMDRVNICYGDGFSRSIKIGVKDGDILAKNSCVIRFWSSTDCKGASFTIGHLSAPADKGACLVPMSDGKRVPARSFMMLGC